MTGMAEAKVGRGGNVWRIAVWGTLAALLALPAVAMRLHAEGVVWTARDFIVMGVLLGTVGLGVELIARASTGLAWRAGAVAAVFTSLMTIWANLAVGMIGSEDNSYNLVFVGVLLLALLGALLARFRAAGMARAMAAAAIAQVAAGAVGFSTDSRGAIFSILFAGPWLISAALFALAAGQQRRTGEAS